VQPSAGRAIEGYASAVSVIAGRTLALHVSTRPAARYRIEVYRLGWYGGAGARLVICEPSCHGNQRGRPRGQRGHQRGQRGHPRVMPAPNPLTGEVVAHWPVTDVIRTSRSWVSGEYLAQLELLSGGQARMGRWVPFVVTPARELRRSILVEVPVNTWEAYNNWGGKSLYAYNSSGGVPAVEVSFDRPFAYGDPNLTFPVVFEYPMLRFLERTGLPLEYVTDVDVDRHPRLLLEHRLSLTLGHGEYWSATIRSAWDRARRAGRDLAFLGADTGYWQIRYADRDRSIIEYRSKSLDPDPVAADKTTTFRSLDPPRPECELLGVEFQQGGLFPPLVNSYTVVASDNPWLRAAGLQPGDVLPDAVRGEWDAVVPGCGSPAPEVLLSYDGAYPADTTLTRTGAGGRVLALGTEGFGALVDGWGKPRCSVNVRAEIFLRAALVALARVRARRLPALSDACPRRPPR
jgi:hypothetical protein